MLKRMQRAKAVPARRSPAAVASHRHDVAWKRIDWLLLLALIAAVFLAYQPVWRAGFIWDDDAHVTAPALRSLDGLGRIWIEPGATQQFYPLVETVFWAEYKLWGDWSPPYHLVNILLHAVAAVLVALVLRRLAIPGAYLAAAIFALHPVHVESVAWITEMKNTLSAVFYLAAVLVYLRYDQVRTRRLYLAALALFVLGLLSKTVIATLPGALLLIFWWQRGRLSWRRDVLPLVPYFAAGRGRRAGYFLDGTQVRGGRGSGFPVDAHRAVPAGGTGRLVLPGQAVLAGRFDLRLSSLAHQPGGVVAIPVSGRGDVVAGGVVGVAAAMARAAGRGALFRRHAVSGPGLLQCVHVHLFLRGRSPPVPGEPGNHHPGCGGAGAHFSP